VWTKTGSVGCSLQLFYKKYDNFYKYIYIYLFNNFSTFTIFTL
jgi:hypothetical protein